MRLSADQAGGREDLGDRPPTPARDATWDVLSRHINDLIILAGVDGVVFYAASPSCRQLEHMTSATDRRRGRRFRAPEDDLDHFNANTAAPAKRAPM